MPKPRGATGATKMKIMAIVCHNGDCGLDSYGYSVWQALRSSFHTYVNDEDVQNVYHHLKDLCELGLLSKDESSEKSSNRCLYRLTDKGQDIREKYEHYLNVIGGKVELV